VREKDAGGVEKEETTEKLREEIEGRSNPKSKGTGKN